MRGLIPYVYIMFFFLTKKKTKMNVGTDSGWVKALWGD